MKFHEVAMQSLTSEQEIQFHKVAVIEQTIQTESTTVLICNVGTKESPVRFVVINDTLGNSTITPPFFIK